MIAKGGSTSGGDRLTNHLERLDTNERMEVKEIRGVVADDMRGALREMEAVAAGAPRVQKPFYHASINTLPHERLTEAQRAHAIDRLEKELGLTDQPRVVVLHEKEGREHFHIVWSRVNTETMRAVSDSHNFRRHEIVSRELEREFGHERVQGAHIERDGKPRPERTATHKEHQQAERTGIKPQEARAELTKLWRATDGADGFVAALKEKDWVLARGDRRDFVAIDKHGGVHSLSRRIEGATAKDIRTRLASIGRDKLLSVTEGRAAQYERFGRPVNKTKAPARNKTTVRRVIGGTSRPAAGVTRAAGRVLDGVSKKGAKLVGLADGLFNSLLGETPKPRSKEREGRALDPGAPQLPDEGARQDEAAKTQARQRYMRQHSREVPDEKQRDADIERDPTTGRDRTRE